MSRESKIEFISHADELTGEILRIMHDRVSLCGSIVRDDIVRKITEGKTRVDGPSEPGTPPHADTGNLRKFLFTVMIDELTAIVGTNLKYGLWLEEGTENMAARPYLKSGLKRNWPVCKAILLKKID